MEQDTNRHTVSAVPHLDGILVGCTCGWQGWSDASPTPDNLPLVEAHIGAAHRAEASAPMPPRREVLLALGAFGFMVCVTVVVVYLIWTW